MQTRLIICALALVMIGAFTLPSAQANDILWSNTGGSAWLTGSNWTGGAVPTATDNAQFGANPTGSGGAGINFNNTTNAGTQVNGQRIEDVGAIELTSARTSGNPVIGNSSGTAGATGTLRLLGTTVNGVSNVILRSNSSQNLTIQDTQSSGNQTMAVSLGNTTENKIVIDSSGNLVISSVIKSNSGTTPLTIMGAGSGRVDITNTANTFTGNINITGGEVRFTADGSLGNAANTVTVDGGRLAIVSGGSVDLSSRSIFLGATAGTSISAPGGGVLTYNGVLADKTGSTGILVKQGTGTLALGGVSIYTGDTSINNGTVRLTTGNNRLPTGTAVSLGQSASANLGTFDLNGFNQQIAGLNSTTGTNATTSNNTVTSSTAATLTLGGSGTYSYGDGTNTNSGVITGAISLVKSGSGTQTLGDTNTYTGGTKITGGILSVDKDTELGTAPGSAADNITIEGGRLEFTASDTLSATRNVLLGAAAGTAISTKGSGTVLTYNGLLKDAPSSTGIFGKNGSGTFVFGGTSTYTGNTFVNNGTLQLAVGNNRLPTGTVVSIGESGSANIGKLDLNGFNQEVAGLNSNTGINATASDNTVTSASAATLTISGSGTYSYGDGTNANSGVITGSISLVKSGSGTQTLGDANIYTGTTQVNGGTLLINGNQSSATGAVSVSNSGTVLGGTGTIGGAITVNSPAAILGGTGAAASGTLTVANNLTLNSGSIIELALGASGAHSTLARTAGTWTFDATQAFTFIDLGAQTGTFDNIITGLAGDPGTEANWTIMNPGFTGAFSFDGANIDLTLTAVPEPSTWVAGALALGVLGWSRRRRSRALILRRA